MQFISSERSFAKFLVCAELFRVPMYPVKRTLQHISLAFEGEKDGSLSIYLRVGSMESSDAIDLKATSHIL